MAVWQRLDLHMDEDQYRLNDRKPHSVTTTMRLTDDLTSARSILVKGWLFFGFGIAGWWDPNCTGPIMASCPTSGHHDMGFLPVVYFMFYVIEHYVDSEFKFAGLGSSCAMSPSVGKHRLTKTARTAFPQSPV